MACRVVALLLLLLPAAGAAPSAGERSLQPAEWDAALRLPEAPDSNPDPHILEIDLEARIARVEIAPGEFVDAWTYNGGLPGPLIRLSVGDRLIVHFTNRLPKPTTVHWHGVRVPIEMDGVPGVSQPDVQPGESFTYDFVVPDAGLFWYHPHVMSAAQVGFGLYGALLVEDPGDGVGVADQLVLVLSDLSLTPEGTLESPDAGGSIATVFGREGTHVLVNGRLRPALVARSGAPQRWRVVNTARSRYFTLDLGGAIFRQIGGDGGIQEHAVESDTVLVTPGERLDLIVAPRGEAGSELMLRSLLTDRGFGTVEGRFPYDDLVAITFADLPAYEGPPPPAVGRPIAPLPQAGATTVDLELTVVQQPDGPAEYLMRGPRFNAREKTVEARLGETQIWVITNRTKWSHPFHLHGYFFQVLNEDGTPVRPMAWKDTVDIPFDETVRFIVRFDDREGSWMLHCHILDHAEGGLMGMVNVGAARKSHPHHAER